MSGSALKRITREFAEISANPLEGVVIFPIDADMFKWNIELTGPKDSPYEGGRFRLNLTLPETYPFKPPVLSFATKIYHPNVSNDDKGSMCLGILRSDAWKPSCKIVAVLEMARGLLLEPNPEDAVENSIAMEYKNNRANFDRIAREWTRSYAK
ncbi:ubiquitin-conjugating enzyme/RWD-like protein [Pyronema domesticum]|uniref:E2 ubiquitin-conjugating enzyme n=1 Tax=Pyronema omphalodes (strain CBS 100304) TaxID=1076935 RepID=U4KWW7_PYROM|nr:ubiquitin-conjugating enzyme/RWD-like protein [Pyronema domesticum]CCX06171.1 Similar to Ubiquitin-conjugating enzyme E2 4; acc. no. P46595 [Pyronema omphalodes CBS 100304]